MGCNLPVTMILMGVIEVIFRIACPEINPAGTSRNPVVDSLYGGSAGLRGSRAATVESLATLKAHFGHPCERCYRRGGRG